MRDSECQIPVTAPASSTGDLCTFIKAHTTVTANGEAGPLFLLVADPTIDDKETMVYHEIPGISIVPGQSHVGYLVFVKQRGTPCNAFYRLFLQKLCTFIQAQREANGDALDQQHAVC